MSRPTAISPEEQEQIARRIGVLLLQAAPEDWQQITVEYRATGEYHDLLGEIVLQEDGAGEPWEPPEELLEIFEHLREGMYRPDVGTWLSALYIVEKPSSYRIDINFDAEPRWQRPLPRAAYIDELRRYPRAEENVPDWLREKLEGSGTSTQPASSEATESPSAPPQAPPAPVEPAEATAGNFRTAAVFDDFDEHGRPLVTTRVPVSPDEQSALRQYLESAPIVLASRDNEADLLHPEQPSAVPATWHTDGVWMWQGAVPYYLAQYAVPPESALVEHIRARGFALAEIDDRTRDAATRELFERSAANEQRADGPQSGDQEVPSGSDGAAAPDGMYPETSVAEESPVSPREVSAAATGAPDAEPHTEAEFRPGTDEPGDEGDLDRHGNSIDPAADAPAHTGESMHVPVGEVESEESDLAQRTSEQPQFGSAIEYEADPAPAVDETAENDGLAFGAVASDEERADFDESDSWNSDAEPLSGTRHERADAELQEDDEAVLALLHDKLTAFGVSADHYRIGSHTPDAHCLLRDGADWVVTTVPDDHPGEDVRFSHSEQAAAYLLGSLLFAGIGSIPDRDDDTGAGSSIADERAEVAESADQALLDNAPAGAEEPEAARIEAPDEAPLSDADQPEDDRPERDAPTAEQPDIGRSESDRTDMPAGLAQATAARAEAVADTRTDRTDEPATAEAATASSAPEQPQRSESGGHFLFTANQGPPPETETEAPAAREATPAAQEPQPGEEATRFHQAPRPDQPAPPMGQQPPAGQQPTQAVPTGPPNQGQQPGGLPKRPPRPDQGGRPPAGGPAPQGPMGAGQPGPGAPGAGGPPMQAPGPVSGPMNRPPQQQAGPGDPAARPQQQPPQPPAGQQPVGQPPAAGQPPAGQQPQPGQPGQPPQPGQAPAQPNAGAQIQPLRGEPPLTLYRDRRPIMLQPGTDLDRFGEPSGNVTYAARTPFAHRSLPPQWSSRPYVAYRVQRPIQVLRGTAVPWFEQPGGGTAYVLPTAISDLVADGTLIELAGNEASPPPMD